MNFVRFNEKKYAGFTGAPDTGWPGNGLFDFAENSGSSGNEKSARAFAGEIKQFLSAKKNPAAYREMLRGIFRDAVVCENSDPVWDLLDHAETGTDFYSAPASTKYHGSEECGLVRHSLSVAANAVLLAPVMLSGGTDLYFLMIASLFHDFCKTGMYEAKLRNQKNEETGTWEKVPYYTVRNDYRSLGHGVESLFRIQRFVTLPESWSHAVRWHMGAYDITPSDKLSLDKSLAVYREVLLLQTADMMASTVDGL